jgi:hypothetical protein
MNEQTVVLSHKAQELLGVLEQDIEHVERTVSWLNELRGSVIKRDEKNLGLLLEEIRNEGQEYSANEQRRCLIREELAGLLNCTQKELTLTVLGRLMVEPEKSAIAERQQKLKTLLGRLQMEYVSTVALLSDCARINSLFLKTIFERSRPGLVCYDSAGLPSRESGAAFMNMRL